MSKVALCVGINDYPGTGSDLSGCVNDALDWGEELKRRGYEVKTLLDTDATKANVVNALHQAAEKLKYRDRFVFTFSGHGTWVPDLDGDEKDARDEALCCYEVWEGGLITDDELHKLWQRFRHGIRKACMSDSCHSGTVARGFLNAGSIQGKPRFLSPAVLPTIVMTEEMAIKAEERISLTPSRSGPVLISGCADPEYSYDAWFNGRANGAMTRIALDALKTNPRNYLQWYREIRKTLPSATYPQTPQLGATPYQKYIYSPLG